MKYRFPEVYIGLPYSALDWTGALPKPRDLHVYTADEFAAIVGRPPVGDDLDRVNCPDAGLIGHLQCGVCLVHQQPRSVCGCLAPINGCSAEIPAVRCSVDSEVAPCRAVLETERIFGLPDLGGFPAFVENIQRCVGMSNTRDVLLQVEMQACGFLSHLRCIGALVRDAARGGAWRYVGDGTREEQGAHGQ